MLTDMAPTQQCLAGLFNIDRYPPPLNTATPPLR
jgi:hypothetical protein